MAQKLHALAAGCAAAFLFLACDEKKNEPAPAAPATTSAPAPTPPPAASSAAPTPAAASASAAPAASSAPAADEAPGDLTMSLGDVKATKGKVEDGQKKFRLNIPRLQRKCISPTLKKDPKAASAGSLKFTIEIDAEGKPKKISHTAEGTFSDELTKCIKGYIEKEIEFGNDAKATLEATLKFEPKK